MRKNQRGSLQLVGSAKQYKATGTEIAIEQFSLSEQLLTYVQIVFTMG